MAIGIILSRLLFVVTSVALSGLINVDQGQRDKIPEVSLATGEPKEATANSNIMEKRALAAIKQGRQSCARTQWLLEHPQDLGDTANGGVLASIGQFEEIGELGRLKSVICDALFQCRFPEALQAKPARLMQHSVSM